MSAVDLFLCLSSSGLLLQGWGAMRWAARIESRVEALEAA